jgi:hypothetical protein
VLTCPAGEGGAFFGRETLAATPSVRVPFGGFVERAERRDGQSVAPRDVFLTVHILVRR